MKNTVTIIFIFRDGTKMTIKNVKDNILIPEGFFKVVIDGSPDAIFINSEEVLYTGVLQDMIDHVTEI